MVLYPFSAFGRLLVALTLAVLAQADYIMDDTNSTIQYYGFAWLPARDTDFLDTSKLYNGTV
jgi:hypothetical protein